MTKEQNDFPDAPEGTTQVGHYKHLKKANDHALVILSMGLAYWMFPDDGKYRVFVDTPQLEAVQEQLARFDKENRFWPPKPLVYEKGKPVGLLSFLPYLIILIAIYAVQHHGANPIEDRGLMNVVAFVQRHEWWRMITALTLHSDLAHLVGNLGMGCFFAFFVVQIFGFGPGWLAILLAGAAGNTLNAWFYYPSEFYSMGASTALFAGVGLIVGNALRQGMTHYKESGMQSIGFPLFVALVMLGWWGSAGIRTDVTAHLFGLLAGILLGLVLAMIRPERLAKYRYLCMVLTFLLIAIAWYFALA
jgi:rhomboid protease GluP